MKAAESDAARRRMRRAIEAQVRASADLIGRAVLDDRVLAALARVPRHEFLPPDMAALAYDNAALPIGHGQTISQPYIVALMTDLLAPRAGHRLLEVGTGSGYQTAILAELAHAVYTVEIVAALAREARSRLARLGYRNIEFRMGDGYDGWPEHAPYDGILVTAAAREIPAPLVAQLKPGGRLVLPLGRVAGSQGLTVVGKDRAGRLSAREVLRVAFVPLTGAHAGA